MCSNTCECDQVKSNIPGVEHPEEEEKEYVCRKCSSKPFIYIDKSLIECKECFLTSCNKKIRSTIGKSMLLKNNDSILIAYSGGASSSALLDLIKRSMEFVTRREQKFKVSIIHVDTQSIVAKQFSMSKQEKLERLKSLLESTQRNYPEWRIYFTLIEMATHSFEKPPVYYRYTTDLTINKKHFDDLISQSDSGCLETLEKNSSEMDSTDKIKYYQDCIINMIDRVAFHINKVETNESNRIKYVFTGSSAIQLANNLLVNVILGQGSTINSTVNICDRRPLVPIVRPMRDFSKKEIAFYLKARNISYWPQINPSTLANRKDSIQKATEAFLSKLNTDFPSTYSILLRTGNKMQD